MEKIKPNTNTFMDVIDELIYILVNIFTLGAVYVLRITITKGVAKALSDWDKDNK